ncbi:MAG: hypothetical protein ACOYJG_02055 [Prevotella sp.]|jgi:hypothetical protein
MSSTTIVLFVEGDTDKVFFEALFRYYRMQSNKELCKCMVVNLRGVSRYTSKVAGKLSNEILPDVRKQHGELKAVCCSYDTDVFEFAERPVVDWSKVETTMKSIGVKEFCRIKVDRMIEDWLLDDIGGLCQFLKIKTPPKKLQGKDGYGKIQSLFKLGHKLYLKGNSVKSFIDYLDMGTISKKRHKELATFERLLGFQ